MAVDTAPVLAVDLVFRPVESKNTFEETVERLEQAIALGFVQPGENFPAERRLCEIMGVSRATLREAMRVLSRAGYVRSSRGRDGGTTVVARAADLSERAARRAARALGPELFELLDRRRILECGAVELAAERHKTADLAAMRDLVNLELDTETFSRMHPQVHLGFAKLAGSSWLITSIADVHFKLHDLLTASRLARITTVSRDITHKRILEAIAKKDAPGARALMEEHIGIMDRFLRSYAKGTSA